MLFDVCVFLRGLVLVMYRWRWREVVFFLLEG